MPKWDQTKTKLLGQMQRSMLSSAQKLNSAGKARQLQAQLEEEKARAEKERVRRATVVRHTLTRDSSEVSALCFCEELMLEIASMAADKIVNDYFDKVSTQYTAHSVWDSMLATIERSLVTHDVPAQPRDLTLATSSATATGGRSPSLTSISLLPNVGGGSFKKVSAAIDATVPYVTSSHQSDHRSSLQHSAHPAASTNTPPSPYFRKSSLNTTGEELLRGLDLGSLARSEESMLLQSPKNTKLEVGGQVHTSGKSALKGAIVVGATVVAPVVALVERSSPSARRLSLGPKESIGKVGFKIEGASDDGVESMGTPAGGKDKRGGVSFGEPKKAQASFQSLPIGVSIDPPNANNNSLSNLEGALSSPLKSSFRDPAIAMPDYDLYDPPALVRGKWRVDKAPNRIPCDEQSRSAIPLNIRLVTPPSSAISTTTGSSMTARRARAHTTTLGRTLSSGGYNNLNSTLSAPAFSPHSTPQPGGNLITISQSTPSYPTGSGSTRQQQGIFAKTMSSGTPSASESLRLATPRDSVVTATRPPSSENGAAKGPAVGRSAATKGKVDAVSVPPSALKKPSTPLTSSRGESSTPTPRGASATPLLTSQASSPKSATATTLMSTNTVAALTQSAAAATANGTGGAAAGQTQRSRPPSSRPETAKQRAARAKKEQEVALAEVRRVEKEEESALPPDADVESHRQLRERLRREKLSKDSLSLVSQSVSKALSNAQITSKPFVVDGKGLVLNVMTLPESLAGKQGGRQAQKEANAAANNSPNGSVDMQTPRRANRGASPQQTDHGEEELARLIMDPQYANSSDGVVLKCATPRYSISKEESKGTEVAAPSSVSKKLAFQPRRPSAEGQGPANSSHPSARRGNKTAESQRQAEFIVPENMPHMLIDVVPSGGVAHTELTPRPLAMRQQMEQKFGEGSGGGAVSTTVAVTASGAPVSSAASIGVRRQAEMVFPPGKMNREEYMRLVAATTTGNQTAKRDGEGFFDVPVPPKTTVPKVPTPPAATTTSATTTTKVTPPTAAASAAAPSTFNLDFSRFSPSSSVNVVGGLATPLTITGRGQGISGGPSRAARSTHSAGAAPAASSARKPSVTSSTVFSKVAATPNPAASAISMDSVHSARSAPRSVQFNLESNGVTVYDAGALLDNGDDYQED